ncbi:MAG TPA: hypothetical protein VEI02_04085 [Planctomycetota bacterium]|nr:hypothetical protein [Planctomycetota bacterium]
MSSRSAAAIVALFGVAATILAVVVRARTEEVEARAAVLGGVGVRPLHFRDDTEGRTAPAADPDDGSTWTIGLPAVWTGGGSGGSVECWIGFHDPGAFEAMVGGDGAEAWLAATVGVHGPTLRAGPDLRRRIRDACERPMVADADLDRIVAIKPTGSLVSSCFLAPASMRPPSDGAEASRLPLRDVRIVVDDVRSGLPLTVFFEGFEGQCRPWAAVAWDPGPRLAVAVETGRPFTIRVEEGLRVEATLPGRRESFRVATESEPCASAVVEATARPSRRRFRPARRRS